MRDAAVLLVDDRQDNLLALEAVLAPIGCRLVMARSGDEALGALLRDEFAAILLDVQMPGMDGFETAELIRTRERTRTVPIIFVTAISKEPHHVFRGYGAGAVDYLFKPLEAAVLRSKVEVFVELYERGRALAESEALLRATFEDAPIGMARAGADGRLRRVNRALCETLGRKPSELVGRTLDELGKRRDADTNATLRAQLMSAGSRRCEVELLLSAAAGKTIPVLVSASLARSQDVDPPDLILHLQDLRERRRAERDREQLIRAESARARAETTSERLRITQSIAEAALGAADVEELLDALLTRLLETLDVDRAAILLSGGDGSERLTARAASGVALELKRNSDVAIDDVAGDVLREGAPLAIRDVPNSGRDTSLLGPAISSLLAVALLERGSVCGTLHVGALTPRDFDAETIDLLRLAADRISLAIAHTRLYERERWIARELQHSLLPKRLPDVPGVALAVCYEPGGDGATVGGDWYEAVALPGGRVAIAIGDVVGRGIEAAATMGQMRSALRAILMHDDSTGTMADRLNRFTFGLGDGEAVMTTVLLAVFDPTAGLLRYTTAGHPPGLVIAPGGAAHYLDGPPAPPMGVLETPRYPEHSIALERGSALVLYTDGVIEQPGEVIDAGLERLRSAAQGAPPDAEAIRDRLLEHGMLAQGRRTDDVTLLVMRAQEQLGERISLEVTGEPGALRATRETLRLWLSESQATAEESDDIVMACNEACENVVEHAHAEARSAFAVDLARDQQQITIGVRDRGSWRETPSAAGRGRGLELMRRLMDEVELLRGPGGTTVRLHRRLAGASADKVAPGQGKPR